MRLKGLRTRSHSVPLIDAATAPMMPLMMMMIMMMVLMVLFPNSGSFLADASGGREKSEKGHAPKKLPIKPRLCMTKKEFFRSSPPRPLRGPSISAAVTVTISLEQLLPTVPIHLIHLTHLYPRKHGNREHTRARHVTL